MALGANGSGLDDRVYGVIRSLTKDDDTARQAMEAAQALTPQPREISGPELALQFFSIMAANASQPGSTVLSSAASAIKPTADEYIRQVEANRKAQAATGPLAISLAKALKPDKVTPRAPVKVIVDGKVRFVDPAVAIREGYEVATTTKSSTARMDVILKNAVDDPTTPLIDETKTSILQSDFNTELHIPVSALAAKGTGVGEELIEMGAVIVDGKPQIDASGYTIHNYNIVDQAGNILRTETRPKIDSLNTIELFNPDGFSDTVAVGSQKERKLRDDGYIFTSKPPAFKGVTLYKDGIAFDGDDIRSSKDEAELIAMDWSKEKPVGFESGKVDVQKVEIYDNGTTQIVTKSGTIIVRGPDGIEITDPTEKAKALEDAVAAGIQITSDKAGGRRAKVISANMALEAFTEVGKIRTNMVNLVEARRLVAEEGANTGVIIDRLPNWQASTIALENAKNRLGLDVIGSVTFGALSESELNLALNTALPTNLSEEALIDWIDRKIAAQNKIMAYFTEQAQFLSSGDRTVGEWLNFKKDDLRKTKINDKQRLATQKENNITYNFSSMTLSEIISIGENRGTLTSSQKKKLDKRMDELLAED